jgi:nucleoside-diphosphate-sugar epimerase
MSTISILGCGWLGLALGKKLAELGHTVKGSTRTPEKMNVLADAGILPYRIDFDQAVSPETLLAFTRCDVLIVTVPFSKKKKPNENVALFRMIANTFHLEGIERIIMISSTSVYPEKEGLFTEEEFDALDPMREAELCFLEKFNSALVVRFSGLIGPERHPGRFLAGRKNLPGPQSVVNLIHLDDCIGVLQSAIEQNIEGALNACMSDHLTRQEFYTTAAKALGLEPPTFDATDTSTGRMISNARLLEDLGYTFVHPTLMEALAHC